MKRRYLLSSFLCGALSAALLIGGMTASAAKAGGGSVSFGSVGVQISGHTVIEKGETLTNGAGQEIPSSILYTDETGGGTTYLPLAAISSLLDIPVAWDGETGFVNLGENRPSKVIIGGDLSPSAGEIQVGKTLGYYTEVEPYWPTKEQIAGTYDKDTTVSSPNGYSALYFAADRYLAISVTNNSDAPVLFSVDSQSTLTNEEFPIISVPVGETVVRSFYGEDRVPYLLRTGLKMSLGFEGSEVGLDHNVNVVVNAVKYRA